MMNKFKFGDRVNHWRYGIGIVVHCEKNTAEVVFSDSSYRNAVDVTDIKLVPHRDTARLNYIDDFCAQVDFVSQYDTLTVQNDYCRVKNPINSKYYQGLNVRQAIDNAMQAEQNK